MPFKPFVQHELRNVRRAVFSPTPQHIIDAEVIADRLEAKEQDESWERDPRWYYRWRWALTFLVTILWLILAYHFVIPRVVGGILLGFWYFALGTLPSTAIFMTGKNIIDDD